MSDLLAELAGVGSVEAHGGFTIDPEKAREKLRHYQLADPHRYVLLLVEAGFSSGAAQLEFEVDSDDLHLRFSGEVFAYEQLENIYASLFRSASAELRDEDLARLRGLQQLAFALNSAMALNPRFVRIVSIGPDGCGSELELRPEHPDTLVRVEGREPGNWIHVKERFRPGLLVEFLRSLTGGLVEVELLARHCRWSRHPVVVNGRTVSGPMAFDPSRVWAQSEVVDAEAGIGAAFLLAGEGARVGELAEAQADLCSNGVHIETRMLELAVPGFRAIVDSPRFGKDVSQAKLLHDASYDAVVESIFAAQDHLILGLARALVEGKGPAWGAAMLYAWLRHTPNRGLHRVVRALEENETFAAVAEVPLWPVVGAGPVTTRVLIETSALLRHTQQAFNFAPVDVPLVLHVQSDTQMELLELLFNTRLQDYTVTLEREAERQLRRLEFMTRRHLPELGSGPYLVREPIDIESSQAGRGDVVVRGEVAVASLAQQDGWGRLLLEGCLLAELPVYLPIPGFHFVVHSELSPTDGYDGAQPNKVLALALVRCLGALERAVATLAATVTGGAGGPLLRAALRTYINHVCNVEFARKFLQSFGFNHKQAKRELGALRRRGPEGAYAAMMPNWSVKGEAGAEPLPLERAALYPRVEGGPVSLHELAQRHRSGQRLAWLEPGVGKLPALDREVLLLAQPERQALRALLGSDALEPYAERLAWIRRRDAFMAKRERIAALDEDVVIKVAFESKALGLHGELGLREFAEGAASQGETSVSVFVHGRPLDVHTLELPLPGLVAWVDGKALEINSMFDGLSDPDSLRPSLLEALVVLLERLLARAHKGKLGEFEWWFLAMVPALVLQTAKLAGTTILLRSQGELDEVFEQLEGLFELLERYPERDLEREIGRLRGRNQPILAESVRRQLRRPTRRLAPDEQELASLRRRLLPTTRALFDLPLFRIPGERDRSVTLDTLLWQLAADEPICWVGIDFHLELWPGLDFDVLALAPVERRLLERLFGSASLELVSDWLIGRSRFERRKTISEIRVARGSTLVVMAIDRQDVRGELGVARQSPSEATRSKIRVFREAREVAIVDLPARPFALVGALEFDRLELNAAHDALTSDARNRVRQLVESHGDRLIEALADEYGQLSEPDQNYAAPIVRHLLAQWPPGGSYAARAKKKRDLFARIAELPVFSGARKPWSAAELAEASRHARIATLEYRRRRLELPDTPVVMLDKDGVESTLRALFGALRPLEPEIERQRDLAKIKARAALFPNGPPHDALISLEVKDEGLTGDLWLPAERGKIVFGDDGLIVESKVRGGLCPVDGAITGKGLRIAKDWSRVIVTRGQERLLDRLACKLWEDLVVSFELQSSQGVGSKAKAKAEFAQARELLEALFLRLHESLGYAGSTTQKRKKRRRKGKNGNRYERLYVQVWNLPLLQLRNGRYISAQVAERERPSELAGLDLWTGPSAEELAHQRAVQRREAERAREEKLAEQRQRETSRRRAEAKAREREAHRRRQAMREAEQREQAQKRERDKREHDEREREKRESNAQKRKDKELANATKAAKKRKQVVEPPSPEALLLEALREELRLVRAKNEGLVSNRQLESLRLGEPVRRGPLFRHEQDESFIDTGHALFRAVLAGYLDDPVLLTLLASSAYTYLNVVYVEIADEHEAEFLRLHAAHAATRA